MKQPLQPSLFDPPDPPAKPPDSHGEARSAIEASISHPSPPQTQNDSSPEALSARDVAAYDALFRYLARR